MGLEHAIGLVVSLMLLVYLGYALLKSERH